MAITSVRSHDIITVNHSDCYVQETQQDSDYNIINYLMTELLD